MFYLLFGNYLVEQKVITPDDYLAMKHKLPLQENSFISFQQAIVDEKKASLDTITNYLKRFQADKGYTDSQMERLCQDDINVILPLILQIDHPMSLELICLTIRNLIRFIDPHVYVSKSVTTDEYTCENLAIQSTVGDHQIQLGFSGNRDSLLLIANNFAGEEFDEIDADSYDAICEFINCINGIYATILCDHDINIDMQPPFYYTNKTLQCKNLNVVTVHIANSTLDLILSIDSTIEYL